jgi:hypothetical protein
MKNILAVICLLIVFNAKAQNYKFYQTENIYNQLKLNTKTGEVFQVQDVGQTFIVNAALTVENEIPNRYALFKTENMWTFILLDQFTGKLWQCQYSVKGPDYRNTWGINTLSLSYSRRSKFSIEPLISMFQYYLINDETGERWKFQWSSQGDEYRWIQKL